MNNQDQKRLNEVLDMHSELSKLKNEVLSIRDYLVEVRRALKYFERRTNLKFENNEFSNNALLQEKIINPTCPEAEINNKKVMGEKK